MKTCFDVIVLGAGMAGASLAAELAPQRRVLLLETEDHAGRHATGRSAAMFFESYGNATVRALTRTSRAFLERPPEGFCPGPLMSPRSALFVADAQRSSGLEALDSRQRIDAAQVHALVPILRPEWLAAGAVLDDSGHDIDVDALLQGYLRAVRRAGGSIALGAGEVTLQREVSMWNVSARNVEAQAPLLVNACGAWADAVAAQAGARPVGLQPMRRTALTIPPPPEHDVRDWPLVIAIDESCYFKSDAGQLLLSPANEDLMPPCDAAPEELDVALAVDRFEQMTTLTVPKVSHRWAGLRSFVADRSPVVGFDAQAEGFFWMAGQGGYGIQMAPALARTAASLLTEGLLPADVVAQGTRLEDLVPTRAALQPTNPMRSANP